MFDALSPLQSSLDLLFLEIDSAWRYIELWDRVMGVGNRTLALTFVDLERGIPETVAAHYADTEIFGRAEGYKTYMGSGNKEIPLHLVFQVQGTTQQYPDDAEGIDDIIRKEVIAPARWIEALKNPVVDDAGISHAPPPCRLTIGSLMTQRVILTDAQVDWKGPFTMGSLLPHSVEISCTFTVVNTTIGNYNVRTGNLSVQRAAPNLSGGDYVRSNSAGSVA